MNGSDAAMEKALDPNHVGGALRWAKLFERRGYQPLPSDPSRKKPLCRFAEWWDGGGPTADELWARFPTTNLQVMTGRRWRLAVIDLDGPEANEALPTLGPTMPRTWIGVSGGGGRHLWFTVPDGPPLPRRLLWGVWDDLACQGRGGWHKRKAIEFLGDRSLVMAPPSIHPRTGRPYRFLQGFSPREQYWPAILPRWVIDLPTAKPPESPRDDPKLVWCPTHRRKSYDKALPHHVTGRDVLAAIADKVAVARSWGVRVLAETAGPTGWVDCHDFNRDDRHPSARFHPGAGLFWRPGERSLSLFDLGVATGHYANWRDCCAELCSIYLPGGKGACRDGH
jgi:hypothetical protein